MVDQIDRLAILFTVRIIAIALCFSIIDFRAFAFYGPHLPSSSFVLKESLPFRLLLTTQRSVFVAMVGVY